MVPSDIPELQATTDEGKRLWALVEKYAKLELVDKLTYVLAILLLGGVLLGLCIVAVFCLSMFCVKQLEQLTGSISAGYCIMGAIMLLAAAAVLRWRGALITRPLLRSLMRKFFEDTESIVQDDGEEEGITL